MLPMCRFDSAPVSHTGTDSPRSLITEQSLPLHAEAGVGEELEDCVCCMCSEPSTSGLRAKGCDHFICEGCAESEVDIHLNEMENHLGVVDRQAPEAHIRCFVENCTAVYDRLQVLRSLPWETARRYLEWLECSMHEEGKGEAHREEECMRESEREEQSFYSEGDKSFQGDDNDNRWRPAWYRHELKQQQGCRVKLGDSSAEIRERTEVVRAFMATLSEQHFEVLEVERIENTRLWNAYEQYAESTLRPGEVRDDIEHKWLFHGTREEVVDNIVARNFSRSFCGQNATRYGRGVYFAKHASYSADADRSKLEKYSVPNVLGEKFVFVCRVLVGHTCLGHENIDSPSIRDGRWCDTAVDDLASPTIFVSFHDAQVYPEYLVKFRDTRPPPPPLTPPPPPSQAEKTRANQTKTRPWTWTPSRSSLHDK